MAYTRVNWEDKPSTNTPINATNLNKMDKGIYDATYENGLNVSNEVDEDYRVNFLHSKNLFDKNTTNIINGAVGASAVGSLDANEKTIFIKCEPNTTYTISKIASSRFRVATSTTLPTNGTSVSDRQTGQATDTTLTYTTNASAKYLLLNCWSNNDTSTFSLVLDSIQIEKGSTATSYEPYITPSINVDGEEIYNKGISEYSSSEIRVGTWLGKPLYRKVVNCGTLPNSATKTIAHNISNIEFLMLKGMYATTGNYNISIPVVSVSAMSNNVSSSCDKTNIYIASGSDRSEYTTTYAILEYTKTTD